MLGCGKGSLLWTGSRSRALIFEAGRGQASGLTQPHGARIRRRVVAQAAFDDVLESGLVVFSASGVPFRQPCEAASGRRFRAITLPDFGGCEMQAACWRGGSWRRDVLPDILRGRSRPGQGLVRCRVAPHVARTFHGEQRFGSNSKNSGRRWPKFSQSGPRFGQHRPVLVPIRPYSAKTCVHSGKIGPNLGSGSSF